MKRNITKFLAALALLVFTMPSLVAWGQTDVIDHAATSSNLGNTGTTQWATNFSITGTSGAVYYIHSMGTKDTQNALQWNSNGFLNMTTTCNGKKLKSVTITTTANKNINLYASNTAYSTSAPSGTALATIAATSTGTTYTFSADYTYLALKGTASSTSITNITIEWEQSSVTPTYTVTYNPNGGTGTMVDENSPYEENDEVTLLTNDFTAPEGMMWDSWLVKDADDNTISVSNNQFTMPASNVTVTAQWVADPNATQYEWVLTDLADLTSDDIFVIVGTISGASYSMSNDNGTEAGPTASSVTIENERITSTVGTNLRWNVSGNATNGYTFYPNGNSEKWLYCNTTNDSGSNNNMRVGTGNRKVFSFVSNDYLVTNDTYVDRYVCVYAAGPDWRGYVSGSTAITFYKRQVVNTDPYITANDVELAYDDTEGAITYVLHNASGNITATTTADWITSLTPNATTSTVAIVCTVNNSNESREATVVLAYGEATKEVTVSQAANPNAALTTMDEIFARATEVGNTATDVTITLNNWVVSGANDSSHAFVTDGTKGFMIYASSSKSNHGFNAGDILSGTVQCKVQLYNGSAEITNLTSASDGLSVTTGGSVTIANIGLADLAGINTGALVSYENLTCSVTTSGNYTNYYLTDGTTQIQVYHTLYSELASSLEDGKTYNITGVFVKNNNTKRVLPRSAEDIVEVVITEPNTITAGTLTHVSINELWDDEMNDINLGDEVEEGTMVFFSLTVDENYTLESVSVLDANNTAVQVTENEGSWSFTMPNSSVTINATATESSVTPVTGDKYVKVTSTTDLTDGQYLIVYEDGNAAFDGSLETLDAVGNTIEVAISNSEIAATETTTAAEFTIDVTNGKLKSASGYYIGVSSNSNGLKQTEDATTYINSFSIDGDGNAVIAAVFDGSNMTMRYNSASNQNRFRYYGSGQQAIQLYKKVEATPVTESYTLTINGYTDDNSKTGYYLIASPVTVDPANVEGMTEGTFDLYCFNQAENDEWRNYEANQFNLEPGKGYLYAKKKGDSNDPYVFTLTGVPYDGDGEIELTNTTGAQCEGWNLVGNPFGVEAEISMDYYELNPTETELIAGTDAFIDAMQGVFVKYTEDDQTVIFDPGTEVVTPSHSNDANVVLNVTRNRGNVIDRAIVRFGEGQQLPKFQLNPNNTKVYIPEGNQDFAIVRSAAEAEMPVSFRASENGTYTLAVEAENVEMDYLHLIDNMTGMDVDLLQTPNYTFEARTNDYTSRFRLVFKGNSTEEQTTETFAYFNGTSWTVSNLGEATLQVVDVMGRLVSSETINGNATINLNETAGIYMLRLVNGNDVKVQKIVVR